MVLPVCAYIETHNFAFLADTLSIDSVRAGGGLNFNETVTLVAWQEEAGHLSTAGVLTYDVAVVVNPKGRRGRPSAGNKRLYRSVSHEEGIPVTIRADYVIGAIDSECHRCDTPVDVEKRNGSENIAKEVVESPVVIDVKSDSNSSVREAVQIGARCHVGSTIWTIDVEERVRTYAANDREARPLTRCRGLERRCIGCAARHETCNERNERSEAATAHNNRHHCDNLAMVS